MICFSANAGKNNVRHPIRIDNKSIERQRGYSFSVFASHRWNLKYNTMGHDQPKTEWAKMKQHWGKNRACVCLSVCEREKEKFAAWRDMLRTRSVIFLHRSRTTASVACIQHVRADEFSSIFNALSCALSRIQMSWSCCKCCFFGVFFCYSSLVRYDWIWKFFFLFVFVIFSPACL